MLQLEELMRKHGIPYLRVNLAPGANLSGEMIDQLDRVLSGNGTREFIDDPEEHESSGEVLSPEMEKRLTSYDILVARLENGKYTESRESFHLDALFG